MTDTVGAALRAASARLAATSDTARLDAELLMAHALGCSRSQVLTGDPNRAVPDGFAPLVERRARHEPVAYILGEQEFYGRAFTVSPAVLIPRADSESVVEAALEAVPDFTRVLDCGTGSGALLLTVLAECEGATGVGIDASPAALEIAATNAMRLGVGDRALFARRDWHEPDWAAGLGQFGLILANPPYVESDATLAEDVRHEPASALFAGAEGLDDYRALLPALLPLLTPGGVAVVEIGHRQGDSVAALAADAGFESALRRDLGGRARALILRKSGE